MQRLVVSYMGNLCQGDLPFIFVLKPAQGCNSIRAYTSRCDKNAIHKAVGRLVGVWPAYGGDQHPQWVILAPFHVIFFVVNEFLLGINVERNTT